METITVKGKNLEVNESGFLANPDEWNRDVASYIAAVEGITMTDRHWEVVNYLRDYYQQNRTAPAIKVLMKEIGSRIGAANAKAKYLYELYPCGPDIQACKIAGLPNANGCA